MTVTRLFTVLVFSLILSIPITTAQDEQTTNRTSQETYTGEITAETPQMRFSLSVRRSETRITVTTTEAADTLDPAILITRPSEAASEALAVSAPSEADEPTSLTYTVQKYGNYEIAVSGRNETTGTFEITVQQEELSLEYFATGTINDETPFIEYPLEIIRTGTTVTLDLKEITAGLDTKLYLVRDATGNIVRANDDRATGDTSSRLAYREAAAGDYTIIVSRYGGRDGDTSGEFRLQRDLQEPEEREPLDFQLQQGDLENRGFPDDDAFAPRDQHPWTVFAYYGGDSNLEANIIEDLNEFEIAGSTDNVRIVVLIDRTPEYDTSNGDWTTGRLYEVPPAAFNSDEPVSNEEGEQPAPTIDSELIQDLGEVDTGDGEMLAQFLAWGIRNYPSDNYIISMGGHGAAWNGHIKDRTDNSVIPLPEMQEAFSLALQETELDHFAFLINDACYMSSIEYYDAIQPYFAYSLASPEIVVNPAHDMTLFINQLDSTYQEPSYTSIGDELTSEYIDTAQESRAGSDSLFLTSSLTDLTRFDDVTEAVEDFAQVMNGQNPQQMAQILGEARATTYTYSHFKRNTTLIDLQDLMKRIIRANAGETINTAAQNVIDALDAVRLVEHGGERVAGRIGYYNIYFPEDADDFDDTYIEKSDLDNWGRMLRNYYNAVELRPWESTGTFHAPITPRVNVVAQHPTGDASTLEPSLVSLEIIGRNIAFADATYDQVREDGTVVRLLQERLLTRELSEDGAIQRNVQWEPGMDRSNIQWDVTLPVVTDGTTSHNEMMSLGSETASLQARYCEPGQVCETEEEWNYITLIFSRDGELSRIVSEGPDERSAVAVLADLPLGSEVQVFQHVVTADGRVVRQPGNVYTWPADGMSWSWEPAPTGEYNVGYQVTAFGGTTGFASTEVTVDNAGVPADTRAYSRQVVNYTIPYPDTWTPLTRVPSAFTERAASEDGVRRTQVYFGSGTRDEAPPLQTVAENVASNYGFTITSDYQSLQVDEQPALAFDMQFQDGEQTYVGRAFATILESGSFRRGIVISSEALESDGEFEDQFQRLLNYTRFTDFAPYRQRIDANQTWMMYEQTVSQADVPLLSTQSIEHTFPIPTNWTGTAQQDDIWLKFSPPDPSGISMFATTTLNLSSEVQDVPSVLSNILTGYASRETDQITINRNRKFYSRYHTWDVTTYTARRDGQTVSGRIYATQIDGVTHAAWFEVPYITTQEGYVPDSETIRSTFELVLDGFNITGT